MSAWVKGRAGVAGVVVLVAALMSGCGGSSSSPASPAARPRAVPVHHSAAPSASKVVLASVRTTAAAKSARVALSLSTRGLGEGGVSVSADGVVNFANGDSQLTLHLDGPSAKQLPDGIEERSVNKVVYVSVPGRTGDTRWFSVDAGKVGSSSNLVPGLGQSDPSQFLASLETISDNVKKVGSEMVRGTETTHYRASLDLGKALDQSKIPPQLRGAEKQFLGSNGATPTMPVDVFVDADGYVRRISLDLDLGAMFAGLGGTGMTGPSPGVTVSFDLYDFGVPVDVQAPPADQISSMKDSGLNGGGGFGTPAGSVSSAV